MWIVAPILDSAAVKHLYHWQKVLLYSVGNREGQHGFFFQVRLNDVLCTEIQISDETGLKTKSIIRDK